MVRLGFELRVHKHMSVCVRGFVCDADRERSSSVGLHDWR